MDEQEKKHICVKCKKEKTEKEGVMILEGSAYCCKECYEHAKENHKDEEVCEFC